jgi:tripartite-type tricarboxylate transporter receptor subunit TctC
MSTPRKCLRDISAPRGQAKWQSHICLRRHEGLRSFRHATQQVNADNRAVIFTAATKAPIMKRLLLATAAAFVATSAFAEYPEKPVTIVVPFAAGGPTDKVARDLAEALRKPLGGQPIIIENVGGAGGTLGAGKVAKASNDGYTLLLHHIGMSTSPSLYRKMAYDTLGDFEYLGMVNEVPMTLIGKPTLPANNYAELVKWMDANKGKINLANAGLGAASHLCGLLFQSTLKIDMQTVPYKGTGPAMTDLLGGQVDLMCDQTTNTSSQIEGGKVKAFAVTSPKRLTTPALKNLPTLDESGLKGFNVSIWHGMYAPKGTPKAVTDKINAALRIALKDPEFIKREEALGAVVMTDARLGGAEHKKFVEAEINKWGPVIKAAGQYAD